MPEFSPPKMFAFDKKSKSFFTKYRPNGLCWKKEIWFGFWFSEK